MSNFINNFIGNVKDMKPCPIDDHSTMGISNYYLNYYNYNTIYSLNIPIIIIKK